MEACVSKTLTCSLIIAAAAFLPPLARAADAPSPDDPADAAYMEMEKMFGGVPSFAKAFPRGAVAGAWAELRDLEFSDKTALDAKTKALIGLAVSAQIPCTYCIYADTMSARKAGATDQEIQEAVAMSALTRHWSTVLNGMQVDLETFKKEMSNAK